MLKLSTTRHCLLLASVGAVLVTSQVAQAQDPRIIDAVTAAKADDDIENIPRRAYDAGQLIGSNQISLTKPNVGALGRGMVEAIVEEPTFVSAATTPAVQPQNTIANKSDEIGEVAANIMVGIAGNRSVFKKTAKPIVFQLMKNLLKPVKTLAEFRTTTVFRDVAGSIALTIRNDVRIKSGLERDLRAFLLAKAAKIAGAQNKSPIKKGLKQGFNGSLKYEDGNQYPNLSFVSDPVTDLRNI